MAIRDLSILVDMAGLNDDIVRESRPSRLGKRSAHLRAVLALLLFCSTMLPSNAFAQVATLDLLFDLDENALTGCDVATADGGAEGIELRLRTLVDAPSETVTSSAYASCVDSDLDLFGSETPLPASSTPPPPSEALGLPVAPWSVIPGSGASGSTLIEMHLPLSELAGAPFAKLHVALEAAAGADALHMTLAGDSIRLRLAPATVPGLGPWGVALLCLSGLVLSGWMLRRFPSLSKAAIGFGALLAIALPITVRATLGQGSQFVWTPSEKIARDLVGDAPIDVDLADVYAEVDPVAGELWLRADAFFGAPICTDWGLVDPGTGWQCAQEPPPDQGPFGGAVALTFDDGPHLTRTPSVLATLRAENIPATFFMQGNRLQTLESQALALEIHQDPLFRIANHTYSHARLPNLTPEGVEFEIDETNAALRNVADDACFFPKFFRFPYSFSDCTSIGIARSRGLGVTGFNFENADWCFGGGGGSCVSPWVPVEFQSDLVAYTVHHFLTSNAGGGILLLHDVHQNTVDLLPQMIAALRAEGAFFVDLADPMYFPILNGSIQPPAPPACCNGTVN